MAKFISDEEMAKLESAQPKKVISDAEMEALEASESMPSTDQNLFSPEMMTKARSFTQGLTGGFADEAGGAIDAALKASGGLFLGQGESNPYADQTYAETYAKGRDEIRNLPKDAGFELAGAVASPVNKLGVVGSGFVSGLGMSKGDTRDEILQDAATGGLVAGVTGIALDKGAQGAKYLGGKIGEGFEALSNTAIGQKVTDAIKNSKYVQAFKGGKEVGKFSDAINQTDLANRIGDAISDSQAAAATQHAGVREVFTRDLGNKSVPAADIAATITERMNRFGPDLEIGGEVYGAMTPKETQKISGYLNALDSDLNAQQLYKIWDDVKKAVDYSPQEGGSSAYNQQLQALQSGIKSKLHDISDELVAADETVSQLARDAGLLRGARKDTTVEGFLAGLGGRNKGNVREALDRTLSNRPELLKEIENFQTYQKFNQQGGFGSSSGVRTLAGAVLGSGAGGLLGDKEGATAGAALGAGLSNPQLQRTIITQAGQAFQNASGISGHIFDNLAPKFQSVLQEAANRGGNAAAVTYFLLQSSDPEFQAQIKEDSSK